MGELPVPTGVDLTGHQIAADGLERRRPPADPDPVAAAERFEPVVVADRVAVVLGLVVDEVDAQAGALEARQASVVVDGPVADRAGRELGGRARRLAVRQPAATAERAATLVGRRPALEADDAITP